MDPLSLTANILTITHLSAKIIRKSRTFFKASQDYEELVNEVHRLCDLAIRIRDDVLHRHQRHQVEILLEPLSCVASKLHALNSLLSGFSDASWTNKATQSRARWTLKKDRLLSLRNELRELRLEVIMGLSLISTYGEHPYTLPAQKSLMLTLCTVARSRYRTK